MMNNMKIRTIADAAGERLLSWLRPSVVESLNPPAPERREDLRPLVRDLVTQLAERDTSDDLRRREVLEFAGELREAALMGGSGPWLGPLTLAEAVRPGGGSALREAIGTSQGANGIFELELNNWEWRRDINFAWLEFSRWGIQQIILISRLYYIKNPIVRRLVNVCAIYVFGRGVEISSPDQDANDQIKEFLERNQKTLGQAALTDLERRKDYDGNLFFAFFPNADTGECDVRLIDATEVQDIVTDPDDSDKEQYFHRMWVLRTFDPVTGTFSTAHSDCWYPAVGFDPAEKPATINGKPVMWDNPVYHRKCGTVGKWLFGCPRIYPMLDWAKAARKFLEACAAVKAALAQISMKITTKGGQQALAGVKQALETTVNTGNSSFYDQNPTATNGAIWASGPGTALEAFKSQGQGGDPDEVKQYVNMCCQVKDVPPTFMGFLDTSNLATATTLDRPTELAFMLLQEEWREDLCAIVTFALMKSAAAPNSKFREALLKRKTDLKVLSISEAKRERNARGDWRYIEATPKPNAIEVTVTFPAIREGDIPALVTATTEAMTLGNSQGNVVGIDEKTGVFHLMQLLGIEKADEIVEEMFPAAEYNPNRADAQAEDDARAAAAQKAALAMKQAQPPNQPQIPNQPPTNKPAMEAALERLAGAMDRLKESLRKAA
jgi:hypothetical protein